MPNIFKTRRKTTKIKSHVFANHNPRVCTVEPRYNEGQRDWQNNSKTMLNQASTKIFKKVTNCFVAKSPFKRLKFFKRNVY